MKSFVVLLVCLITCCCNFTPSSSIAVENVKTRYYHNSKVDLNEGNVNVSVPGDTVQFFIIGDWGGVSFFPYTTPIEEALAKQMGNMAEAYNTQFQLALGDNFYWTGVKNEDDKRFQQTFESVFDSKNLFTPWFILMGNHDHYGNASAQIAYSSHSKRWILPDYNYTIDVKIKNGAQDLIGILMLDTVILCGNTGFDSELKQPQFLTPEDEAYGKLYLKSIENDIAKIANSSVLYIIVAGHFPVWSAAEHGPTKCLVDNLRPILHKYNVSAYFCGHDHNLQHIQDTYLNTTVDYIVTGAANVNANDTAHINDIPPNSLKYFWQVDLESELLVGGATMIQASTSNMTLTFFSTKGQSLYQKVIYPRKTIGKN